MARNHYVSQLIIRRFSNAINTFDAESKTLVKERKSIRRIFYKRDLYTDEIETRIFKELETPFATLIDKKILNKDKIILTRTELLLVKRFLLMDSIRTYNADDFYTLISKFKQATDRYFSVNKIIDNLDGTKLPSITDSKEDKQTIYMNAMNLFLDCNAANLMPLHKFVTREFYCWARVFLDAYIVFWDSAEEQEFILTDNGMTTEYEPSHVIFEGLSMSKFSYLLAHLDNKSYSELKKLQYATLLSKYALMYENFNIFNLSSTRSIVLANPFFKLYSGSVAVQHVKREEFTVDKPEIWPSCFETKEAVVAPETLYKQEGKFLMDDLFTYRPSRLSVYDTMYVNILALNQKKSLIGFNDIDKVVDSLGCASMMNVVNQKDIYDKKGLDTLQKFVDHMIEDEYNYIFKEYKNKEWRTKVDPFDFLDSHAIKSWKDIKENKYLLEYFLSDEEKIKTMENFAFLGTPDQRVEVFKIFLSELKSR